MRDILNEGCGAYGLGVVVRTKSLGLLGEPSTPTHKPWPADADIEGPRFDVYFNKFERIITFHGDYLEKV